jgi:hypothetical protein
MRTVVAAIFAALLLAAPAQALDNDWQARAGIEKAKAAGIKIDPAAEELMARAPIGTCANDPTLAKCPPAHAVVFTGSTSYADDSTPVAPPP